MVFDLFFKVVRGKKVLEGAARQRFGKGALGFLSFGYSKVEQGIVALKSIPVQVIRRRLTATSARS